MAKYDFSTLNSTDLEELVCDLLNAAILKPGEGRYRTFKEGKDQGIDILFSLDEDNYAHMGQVKHYYRTGYKGLIRDLNKTEVSKVKKIDPERYIFATSVDLGKSETEELAAIFTPYIKNLGDIYGKSDLNRLIEEHDHILDIHHKLWLSDASILTKILSSDLNFRSSNFLESEIKKRVRLYVKTKIFESALESLEKTNFVIISGDPGVGKTTLAEMLVYEYIKEDYRLCYLLDDIKEGEKILKDTALNTVIYLDDFLGSNTVEMIKSRGNESALLNIITRVKRSKHVKLIFTTRTSILNSVVEDSDKLKRAKLRKNETVLDLEDYNTEIKSQLLLNHIDDSDLKGDLKAAIRDKSVFDFIIRHKNFNPRSVEYILSADNVEVQSANEYRRFIIHNFNDPKEIWKHAYLHQLDDWQRMLINTLLTFDEKTEISLLEKAFEKRLEIENAKSPINIFQSSLVKLTKAFIIVTGKMVDLKNPSLKDFLINFIQNDKAEISSMLDSVKYITQISKSLKRMAKSKDVPIPKKITAQLLTNYADYSRPENRDEDLIQIAIFISENSQGLKTSETLANILNEIDDWESLHDNYLLNQSFLKFLQTVGHDTIVKEVLNERTMDIVEDLLLGEFDLERAVELLEKLARGFDIDFTGIDVSKIDLHFDDLFGEYINNELDQLKDWATDVSEVDEVRDKITDFQERLQDLGYYHEVDMNDFECDWYEITITNEIKRLNAKND
ncbi:DNA polymerase III delta prime subunit [Pedobacter sp. CG_S7]|uniref:nSTAND3 domain-containing NTPase n=1 Tax=Pedobacter sp. CG_S7 TaxID=3143930 RepID=UPI00339451D8